MVRTSPFGCSGVLRSFGPRHEPDRSAGKSQVTISTISASETVDLVTHERLSLKYRGDICQHPLT